MTTDRKPEFSRPVAVGELADGERAVSFGADARERQALAIRFGLRAIESLTVDGVLTVVRPGGAVRFLGRIQANVTQTCVVSLEPFAATIEAEFERLHDPDIDDEWGEAEGDHVDLEADTGVVAEPLVDGVIDVGEAAADQLGLELDPYPRAPGASFKLPGPLPGAPSPWSDADDGPFSALRPMLDEIDRQR